MGSIAFNEEPIEIAVVGGGIVGLILTAGLVHRNIKVKLYEQARRFRKIGTGIAFTANVTKCMEIINPAIVAALRSGGSVPTSADKNDPNDYLRWTDGFNERDEAHSLLYKIDAGYRGFEGCRRDQFLEALVKIIPKGTIELRKRLEGVQRSEKLTLHFNDDTRAEADASNLPC
jgi:salicylate hydroxylase